MESATGRPLAEESLRRAEQTEDPVLIGWALNDLAVLIFFPDLQRVGIAILDGAISYCREHHATGPLVAVLFNRAIASFTRDVRAALRIYEQALELCRQAADAWTAWLTTASVSVARMITGRWDDEANDDTAWLYEGVLAEDAVFRYLHAALQALRALLRGERPDDALTEMDEAVLDAAGPEVVQEVALIRLVRARLSGGLRERALDLAEATVSAREGRGATVEWFPFLWTTAVDWLLEAGTPEDLAVARRAVEVVDTAPGRRDPAVLAELPRLRAFLALADPAGTADPETAERELREAIPALEAYGAEPDRGRAQAALGRLLERQGRTEEARALLAEAEGTFARLGVANRMLRLAVAAA